MSGERWRFSMNIKIEKEEFNLSKSHRIIYVHVYVISHSFRK